MVAKHEIACQLSAKAKEFGICETLRVKMDRWSVDLNGYYEDAACDKWMGALPHSSQLFLALWEQCVIKHKFDATMKAAKVAGLSLEEGFWERDALQNEMKKLQEQLEKEGVGQPSSNTVASLSTH